MSAAGRAAEAPVPEGEHPLLDTWVLWELRKDQERGVKESTTARLLEVARFRTVEEFWRKWTHAPKPACVP